MGNCVMALVTDKHFRVFKSVCFVLILQKRLTECVSIALSIYRNPGEVEFNAPLFSVY